MGPCVVVVWGAQPVGCMLRVCDRLSPCASASAGLRPLPCYSWVEPMLLLLPGCAQIMKGHGSTLFGFIADAVKRAGPPPGASVGFTFSFPVNQTALNSGTLMQWTKG
jgi:hypothetical protein